MAAPNGDDDGALRVVHVIKTTGIAGAEAHLLTLMTGLRAQNVDARLLLLDTPSGGGNAMAAAAETYGIPVVREVIHRHLNPGILWRLRKQFMTLKPQIVHTHLIHADLYGIPAAKLARVPVVISSRHNDDPRRKRQPLRLVNQVLWRLTDAGIAISEAVRRFTVEVEGAPPEKIHTILYGIPLPVPHIDKPTARRVMRSELGLAPETPLMGIVSRLVVKKAIPDALVAFAQIATAFQDAHLVIAGDGPLMESLKQQVEMLDLRGRVHFLGWRGDVPAIMAALDVFLMPSTSEGFGLTLLEAMAQRTPIIGSTASSIPEIVVNGETGITFPAGDIDALAAAMHQLLSDESLRTHYGLMGEKRLESHFDAAQMVAKTLALYHELSHSS